MYSLILFYYIIIGFNKIITIIAIMNSRLKNQAVDYKMSLIMIGDSEVGKTCFLLKFADENFNTSHISTIGIDFKIKTI